MANIVRVDLLASAAATLLVYTLADYKNSFVSFAMGVILADLIDLAEQQSAPINDAFILAIRQQAAQMPAGEPGNCNKCGEDMPRLVNGVCCRCRDRLRLP